MEGTFAFAAVEACPEETYADPADRSEFGLSSLRRTLTPTPLSEGEGLWRRRPAEKWNPVSQAVVAGPATASWWIPATARPDGSAIFAKLASQAIAAGDEQAIDLPPGTVSAAAGDG